MAEFVTPPRQLGDKTGRGTPGAGDRLIKKANDAVKAHQDRVDYQSIAQGSLDRLNRLLHQLLDDPRASDVSRQIFELCHDMRGEGASFGYPAVSRVADLICRVMDSNIRYTPRFAEIVKIEVESIRAMVRFNVKGNPRGAALEVIDALEFLVDNYLDKLKAA